MNSGQGDDFACMRNLWLLDFIDLLGNLREPRCNTAGSNIWNEFSKNGGSQALTVCPQLGLST